MAVLRPTIAALGSAALVATFLATAGGPAASLSVDQATHMQRAATPLPERLRNVGESDQVVVVTATSWSTSWARLQTWQRGEDGTWRRVLDPVPARLGWNGLVPGGQRIQGSGETPAGTFRLLRGFGLVEPAGVELQYRVLDANDWWPYDPQDPKTYNVFQPHRSSQARWRTSWAEDLDSYRSQYRFAVVLDYNLPSGVRWVEGQRVATEPADTRRGGGIFLHVWDDGPTAGCIAVSRDHMRQVLQWLDPAAVPKIVIGPPDWITTS